MHSTPNSSRQTIGEGVIAEQLERIPNEKIREKIRCGERDFRVWQTCKIRWLRLRSATVVRI